MKLDDWFNQHDLEHLSAYKQLCEAGAWPKGFIPQTLEFPEGWRGLVSDKIAAAWVKEKLTNLRD